MDANRINYTITNHNDLKKIIIQPFLGLNISYPISKTSELSSGYTFSITSLGTDEIRIYNLINHSVYFGFNLAFWCYEEKNLFTF